MDFKILLAASSALTEVVGTFVKDFTAFEGDVQAKLQVLKANQQSPADQQMIADIGSKLNESVAILAGLDAGVKDMDATLQDVATAPAEQPSSGGAAVSGTT